MRRVFAFRSDSGSSQPRRSRRECQRSNPWLPGKKLMVAVAKENLPARPTLVTQTAVAPRKLDVVACPLAPLREPVNAAKVPARWLGLAAFLCVGLWWVNGVLGLVASAVFSLRDHVWDRAALPLFFVALLGSHFLAILAGAGYGSREPWGARAVTAFWASILVWVPLGTVLELVGRIIAS